MDVSVVTAAVEQFQSAASLFTKLELEKLQLRHFPQGETVEFLGN